MNVKEVQEIMDLSPFQKWLGLELKEIHDTGIVIHMPWREEVVATPGINSTHGGILAALIDLGGFFAVLATGGSIASTADLHVDYHKAARPGPLILKSEVRKSGKRSSVGYTEIYDENDRLIASGRGLYMGNG